MNNYRHNIIMTGVVAKKNRSIYILSRFKLGKVGGKRKCEPISDYDSQ